MTQRDSPAPKGQARTDARTADTSRHRRDKAQATPGVTTTEVPADSQQLATLPWDAELATS